MSENLDYWHRQSTKKLYSDIDMMAPEQRRFAGKLLIIGGNKGMFFAVANALETAKRFGAGEVRALMPDALKNQVPSTPELYFAEAETSGAFGRLALQEMLRQAEWADAVLLIGDSGKNAETSLVFAEFMNKCQKPVYITRDAVEAVTSSATDWAMRDYETGLLLTMPQLQKMLRTMYYPKVITLSMPTNQLVETLHKFTLSYPVSVATYHNDLVIMAEKGEVVTQSIADTDLTPISLWSGALLVKAIVARLWNPEKDFYKVLSATL
jgi:PHD/YefM family antitoxin component YafN of YafNO toxin-antitoxin module